MTEIWRQRPRDGDREGGGRMRGETKAEGSQGKTEGHRARQKDEAQRRDTAEKRAQAGEQGSGKTWRPASEQDRQEWERQRARSEDGTESGKGWWAGALEERHMGGGLRQGWAEPGGATGLLEGRREGRCHLWGYIPAPGAGPGPRHGAQPGTASLQSAQGGQG